VQARAQRDAKYRKALLQEAVECLLGDDISTGKAILRNYINAAISFEKLEKYTGIPSKSLMRMFSPSGNPTAVKLFSVIACLQEQEGIHFEVKARTAA